MIKRNASILMVAWLVLWAVMACRCGIDPLLPTINAAVNLAQGFPADGRDGINCWDLNGDGFDDDEEDINGDGVWDAWDCQGDIGESGPTGLQGSSGIPGPIGETGEQGDPGAAGPQGEPGRDGVDGGGSDCDHHPGNSCGHHRHVDGTKKSSYLPWTVLREPLFGTLICHYDEDNPFGVEQRVADAMVPVHISHGDCEGSCSESCPDRPFWMCHLDCEPGVCAPCSEQPVCSCRREIVYGQAAFDAHIVHGDCHFGVGDCCCNRWLD